MLGTKSAALAFGGLAALTLGCGSGGSGGAEDSAGLSYVGLASHLRVGEALDPVAPQDAGGGGFSVSPELPPGLALDPDTGTLSGTPAAESAAALYQVEAQRDGVRVATEFELRVGPQLPGAIEWLAPGLSATVVAADLATPARMVLAPDGRLFFCELGTGRIRIIDAADELRAEPFATLEVATGGHRGLLGIALPPDFDFSGFVYVLRVAAAGPGGPLRTQVVRLREESGLGVEPTVIVDDLPAAEINNGGELLFDLEGRLLVTLGDVEQPELAQDTASLAGKLLGYTEDGTPSTANPDPASPVLASGLRNVFGLAVHPFTGDIFGADNGPDEDDRLQFLQPGRNFGWGLLDSVLGATAGFTVRTWEDVITPTAIVFHEGTGRWSDARGALLLTSYSEGDLRMLELSGGAYTDFQGEEVLAEFLDVGQDHKPLDLLLGSAGELYVSTFTAIYRIDRF